MPAQLGPEAHQAPATVRREAAKRDIPVTSLIHAAGRPEAIGANR
jgi:hypothetical protein